MTYKFEQWNVEIVNPTVQVVNVNEQGWVNYPDYQWRIWKNKPEIKWVNKVHERLDGFKTYVALPPQEEFSLYHPKDIERQEKQNKFYEII